MYEKDDEITSTSTFTNSEWSFQSCQHEIYHQIWWIEYSAFDFIFEYCSSFAVFERFLFSFLNIYYSNELNEIMFNSLDIVSMSKRIFWSVFQVVWQKAFISENIKSEFFKMGIFSLNSSLVLDKIIKKTSSSINKDFTVLTTFMTDRAVRRVHKAYMKQSTSFLLKKVLNVNKRLTAEHFIDQHIIRELTEVLKMKKRQRKRDVRLNLLKKKDERS